MKSIPYVPMLKRLIERPRPNDHQELASPGLRQRVERARTWAYNRLRQHVGASKYMPHQGARERARRVRQMERHA